MKTATAILAILLLLAAALSVQAAESKKLGFRNKTSKILQLDCSKSVKGRSAYTCFDRDGNETHLDEGQEWERINFEKVCFKNKDDRIHVCLEITTPGKKGKISVCDNGKNQYAPPGQGWERMIGDSKICTEQIQHYEVPKKMEFSISGME